MRRVRSGVFPFGLVLAALLAAGMYWIGSWRVRPSGISRRPIAARTVVTAGECLDLCKQATLAVPGVNPAMTQAALKQRFLQVYGPAPAETLTTGAARYVVGQGKIFFPNDGLCGQPNLGGECREFCARYHRTYRSGAL